VAAAKAQASLEFALAKQPEHEYWVRLAEDYGQQVHDLLPAYLVAEEVWSYLDTWARQSNTMTRALGYKHGAAYLVDCQQRHTAADLDVLLSKIRGRLWHVADLDEAQAEADYARDMRTDLHN
jgi:hypothetical protein